MIQTVLILLCLLSLALPLSTPNPARTIEVEGLKAGFTSVKGMTLHKRYLCGLKIRLYSCNQMA